MSITNGSLELLSAVPVVGANVQVTQAVIAFDYASAKAAALHAKAGKLTLKGSQPSTPASSAPASPTAQTQTPLASSPPLALGSSAFFPPSDDVAKVLNKYPPTAGFTYSYGTSGFRAA